MNEEELMQKFRTITDPNNGDSIVSLGMIEEVEINEDAKRVYVTIKEHHNLAGYVEKMVRDIIDSYDYDLRLS